MDQQVNVANLGEPPIINVNDFTPDGRFLDPCEDVGDITIYVWVHHLYPNVFWYTSSSFIKDRMEDLTLDRNMHLSVYIVYNDQYSFKHWNERWIHSEDRSGSKNAIALNAAFRRARSDYEAEKALLEE